MLSTDKDSISELFLFDRGFWADILAIQDIGSDRREMISSLRKAEKIEEIAEENCYLQDRKKIAHDEMVEIVREQAYEILVEFTGSSKR